MAHFFQRLNPNVVFVTIIALIVIATYVGRQEYLDSKRTSVEAECAKQSVYQMVMGTADIIPFGTITSLCIQSGGFDEYYEVVKLGTDEKAKRANTPSNNE